MQLHARNVALNIKLSQANNILYLMSVALYLDQVMRRVEYDIQNMISLINSGWSCVCKLLQNIDTKQMNYKNVKLGNI